MKEIWKDIAGYEGLYQVSNLGRVKSLYREFWSGRSHNILKKYPEKFMNVQKYKDGYEYVVLCKDGKPNKLKVHRLVGIAFIQNPENKPHIDHINTIRSDNRSENLRWVTQSENQLNPISVKKASLSKMGNKNPMRKRMRQVIQIDPNTNDVVNIFDSAVIASKHIGVDHSNIYRAINGMIDTCGGYKWRYIG